MQVSHQIQEDVCIISILEDITYDTAEEIKTCAFSLLDSIEVKGFIVDMKKVERLDSLGIGVIISLFNRSRKKQQVKLVFCNINNTIKEIISLTNLNKNLNFQDSLEEARAAIQ